MLVSDMLPRLDYLTAIDIYVFACIGVLCLITLAHGYTIAYDGAHDFLLMRILASLWVVFNVCAAAYATAQSWRSAAQAIMVDNDDEVEEELNAFE